MVCARVCVFACVYVCEGRDTSRFNGRDARTGTVPKSPEFWSLDLRKRPEPKILGRFTSVNLYVLLYRTLVTRCGH